MSEWESNPNSGNEELYFGDRELKLVANERFCGIFTILNECLDFNSQNDSVEKNKRRAIHMAEKYLETCLRDIRSLK